MKVLCSYQSFIKIEDQSIRNDLPEQSLSHILLFSFQTFELWTLWTLNLLIIIWKTFVMANNGKYWQIFLQKQEQERTWNL